NSVPALASFALVLAVLRQSIQGLGTRVALPVDYPGRVILYPGIVADRGLPRSLARGAALDIGKPARGASEKFLLLGTVRAPGGAVEFGVGLGEMLRKAADPRIFRTSRFAQIAGIVEMQSD